MRSHKLRDNNKKKTDGKSSKNRLHHRSFSAQSVYELCNKTKIEKDIIGCHLFRFVCHSLVIWLCCALHSTFVLFFFPRKAFPNAANCEDNLLTSIFHSWIWASVSWRWLKTDIEKSTLALASEQQFSSMIFIYDYTHSVSEFFISFINFWHRLMQGRGVRVQTQWNNEIDHVTGQSVISRNNNWNLSSCTEWTEEFIWQIRLPSLPPHRIGYSSCLIGWEL